MAEIFENLSLDEKESLSDIINDDVNPDHVWPDHILFILGRVHCPPAGHTEDVDNTCDAVEHIVPAAVQPYILAGEPPLIPAFERWLEIAGNGDQDIAFAEHKDIMTRSQEVCPQLKPGVNYDFYVIPGGVHDMKAWQLHLYHALQIFFR